MSGSKWAEGAHLALLAMALSGPVLAVEEELSASPQEGRGTLAGRVIARTDGQPLAGASVLVVGTPLVALTDDQGHYRLSSLLPGLHTVYVSLPGYASQSPSGILLQAGETTRVDFALEEAPIALPGLVVTASRLTERPGDATATVAVIPETELTQRSLLTVDDALPFVAGVSTVQGQVSIRGSSGFSFAVGSRVLALVDGIPVLTGDTGEIDWDALPILDLDRVEVLKGPSSSLYGTNALGGVVNLISRHPTPGRRTLVRAFYGRYDTPGRFQFTDETLNFQGLDLRHQETQGGLTLGGYLGRKTSDGFRQNGDFDRWYLGGRVEGPLGRGGTLKLLGSWAREDHGNFLQWRDPDHPFEVPPPALGDWLRADKLFLAASARGLVAPGLLVTVTPHLYRTHFHHFFHDDSLQSRAIRGGLAAYLSAQPWRAQTLTGGAELIRGDIRSDLLGDQAFWEWALYLQDDLRAGQAFRLSLGARVDYHQVEGLEGQTQLSPKLGLVYRPSAGLSLRASVNRGFRAPSVTENFVDIVTSGFHVIPNPGLKGETAWAVEVGGSYQIGDRLWLDGALFQTWYEDLIEVQPVPGRPFTFQFANLTRAWVRGLELALRTSLLGNRAGLALNYALLDTKDRTLDEPLPYRSRHTLSTTAWTRFVGVEWAADLRYQSRVQRTLVFPFEPRDPIAVTDLRITKAWRGLTLNLKLANLLGNHYVEIVERNAGPPRHAQLTLTTEW